MININEDNKSILDLIQYIDVKIVRLFNTYGPKMNIDDGRVITNFIKEMTFN